MNVVLTLCLVLWLYLLSVLKRAKLDFAIFLVGSVGAFVFMLLFIQPVLIGPMTKSVAAAAGVLGEWSGFYASYYQYGMLFVYGSDSAISMYIDYECSGIIEMMAFSSMLLFFDVYRIHEKIAWSIAGFLWIFAANILRIFVICTVIHFFGNDLFYLAHTIFGRLIFYLLSIALYYHVFTHSQIRRMKVGKFSYGVH